MNEHPVLLAFPLLWWLSLQPSAGSRYLFHLHSLIGMMLHTVKPQLQTTDLLVQYFQQAPECCKLTTGTSVLTCTSNLSVIIHVSIFIYRTGRCVAVTTNIGSSTCPERLMQLYKGHLLAVCLRLSIYLYLKVLGSQKTVSFLWGKLSTDFPNCHWESPVFKGDNCDLCCAALLIKIESWVSIQVDIRSSKQQPLVLKNETDAEVKLPAGGRSLII